MKDLLFKQLHSALKDQDWIEVARAALQLEKIK